MVMNVVVPTLVVFAQLQMEDDDDDGKFALL